MCGAATCRSRDHFAAETRGNVDRREHRGGLRESSRSEVVRYLDIAAGSAAETEHHLAVWRDLGRVEATRADELLTRVTAIRRMLPALRLKLPE